MSNIFSNKPLQLNPICLADIQAEDVKFWWRPYIPAGTLTLLYGYGGIGKSWISCALAADASAGRPLPGHTTQVPPQKILMATAEDDAAYVLKPRMEALGANMDNIFVLEDHFTLDKRGVSALYKAMETMEAAIVFLDPLVSYLGGQMDINKSNEARAMIGPLARAARDTGCAVVVIHHERKGGTGRVANRAMGSADFINGVRSALHIYEDKDGQKIMKHAKANWSSPGPSLEFAIDGDKFRWGGEPRTETGEIVGRDELPVKRARALLVEMLMPGPQAAGAVMARARELGISQGTLNRAKVGITKAENKGGVWWLSLQEPHLALVAKLAADDRRLSSVNQGVLAEQVPPTVPSPSDLLSQVGRGPLPRRLAASLFAPITV